MTQIPRMLLLCLVLCIVSRIATAALEFKPDFSRLQPRSDREHQSLGKIFLSVASIAVVKRSSFSPVPRTRHV